LRHPGPILANTQNYTMFISFSQLYQIFRRQQPQPPHDVEAAPQPRGLELEVVHNHIIDWANIMVTVCLASVPTLALTFAQLHSKYSPTFHVVSFEFLLLGWSMLLPSSPLLFPFYSNYNITNSLVFFFTLVIIISSNGTMTALFGYQIKLLAEEIKSDVDLRD
jgi:hypothetical protein